MLAIGAATPVMAQDTRDQQIQSLLTRVSELESRAERPPLAFGENNTSFEIYGYVKADAIYDLDYDLGNTIFGLAGIDDDSREDTNFQGIGWETRLGLRTTTPTDYGDLETQIETDFYGSGGGELRLRHATATWNGFRIGKYWTSFMPLAAYPDTIDFQGPAGIPFARQTQFGYLHDFDNGFSLGGYLEDPTYNSDAPAFVGVASYETDGYFFRGTALAGSAEDEETDNDDDVWGFNLSATADLWQAASMTATFTHGEGVATYMVFPNDGLDFEAINDDGDAIETTAGTLGLVQELNDQFDIRAAYGFREDDNPSDGATSRFETVHLTGNYYPVENVGIGLEYIYSERDIEDRSTIRADRIQGAVQVNF